MSPWRIRTTFDAVMSTQSTLDDELMRAPLVMKMPLESIVQPQLEIVAEHDAASAALMPTNMSIRDAIAAVAIGRIKAHKTIMGE